MNFRINQILHEVKKLYNKYKHNRTFVYGDDCVYLPPTELSGIHEFTTAQSDKSEKKW